MRKLYPLVAKNIKKSMKHYDVKAVHCRQGKGTTRGAVYITVKTEDVDKTLKYFREFGIVTCIGHDHIKYKTNSDVYTFGASYMSEEMYNELNETT